MAPAKKSPVAAGKPASVKTSPIAAKPGLIEEETAKAARASPAVTAKAEKIATAIAEAAPGKKSKKAATAPAAPAAAPAAPKAPKKEKAPKKAAEPPAGSEEEAEVEAPKPRAMTAYNKYMKLRLHEMKEDPEYADKKHNERFAAIGPEWKAMTDAEKAEAVVRAEQYIEDLAEPPKAPRKKRVPKEEKPKRHRAPTAYNYFMAHRIHTLKEEQPDLSHNERFSMAASEWKLLDGEEKENAVAEAMRFHEEHPKPPKKGAAAAAESEEEEA